MHTRHIQHAMLPNAVPVASLLPPLSLSAPGALYGQIIAGIHTALASGQLPPGAPLPSERRAMGNCVSKKEGMGWD